MREKYLPTGPDPARYPELDHICPCLFDLLCLSTIGLSIHGALLAVMHNALFCTFATP
ncbi:MAG: hypothetical protein AAF729_11030 [Pseudomonadota bacterium]